MTILLELAFRLSMFVGILVLAAILLDLVVDIFSSPRREQRTLDDLLLDGNRNAERQK